MSSLYIDRKGTEIKLSGEALVSSILNEGKNGVNQIVLALEDDDEEDL